MAAVRAALKAGARPGGTRGDPRSPFRPASMYVNAAAGDLRSTQSSAAP